MKITIDVDKPKKKKNKKVLDSHVCIVLDRSGSMESVKNDTIGGLRQFIKDQQKVDGKCTFTLIQFDSQNPSEVVYDNVNINNIDANSLSFHPRGGTPLLDAIGQSINKTQNHLYNNKAKKIIFVIITDGLENASREYTQTSIKNMISEKKEKEWEFVFIGANQDAFLTAQIFNIDVGNSINYSQNQIGTQCLYGLLSSNVSNYRSGQVKSMNWTGEDRSAQENAK